MFIFSIHKLVCIKVCIVQNEAELNLLIGRKVRQRTSGPGDLPTHAVPREGPALLKSESFKG